MKRFLSVLAALALALALTACTEPDAVTFYYVRDESAYQFGTTEGVIAGEDREAAGHVHDLRYLMILYLHGPVSENLRSPFPSGTSLVTLEQTEDTLTIRLSSIASVMKDTDLTLACACIARTCFEITDVQSVTIMATGFGDARMTMTRDSLLLVDDSAASAGE